MVRRLANSRNVPKSVSTISLAGSASSANNAVISFNALEMQGLQALFAGFIDLYCESIPVQRRAHMKEELRSFLVSQRVIPDDFFTADLSPVRIYCAQIISGLARSVVRGIEPADSRSRPFQVFNQSRFRTEFEEIETIGRGGFGHVYRVRSLVDKHEYAIKKIVARDDAEQLSQKILHEVQILAALQHVNIVRYHCGWIEVENIPTRPSNYPSFTPQRPPPRARKDSPRINIQEIFDSDSGPSPSVQEIEEEGGEESMASVSSVGSAVVQRSPVGGRFWGGAETSSESIEDESTTSPSVAASIPVDGKKGGESSLSSMGSAVVRNSPVGGRFWNGAETSIESIEDESITPETSPVLATAIPMGEKEKGEGEGDGEWSEQRNGKGEGRKEVAVMQLTVRMVIFIQMELCTSTLEKFLWKRNEQLMRQSIPVDGQESLSLFRQLISAVEYIHEKGLIHRDIKPGNLFLKMDRLSSIHLLLGDFGLSCLHGEERGEEENGGGAGDGMLVPSGAHSIGVGTTTYAAPEQMRTTTYGREVDLFSAGVVLLELYSVVGTGSERLTVIERLREGRQLPQAVAAKWPTISSLVLRLTSPNPEERPTATAILNELREEASEIRSLREMMLNKDSEIAALRKENKRLRVALAAAKKERKRANESHSSA